MLVPALVSVRLLGPLIEPANVATLFTVRVLFALTNALPLNVSGPVRVASPS